MVYNSGNAGLTSVRMETGNILPEDFPDSEITLNIENAYSYVQLICGRALTSPFTTANTEYGMCRELEKKAAAMYCLKAYGPEFRDKIEELRTEIKEDTEFLKANIQEPSTDPTASTPFVYTPAAVTFPKNLAAIPYRSIKGSGWSTLWCCYSIDSPQAL